MHLREASQGVGSAAVDESTGAPGETPERPFGADEDELTSFEEELVVIEAAMDRIDNGDLEGYDRLVAQLGQSGASARVEALPDRKTV